MEKFEAGTWDWPGMGAVEKLSAMAVFHKTMEEFLYLLDFGEEGDLMRRGGGCCTADTVSLMTLHGSKGLEFPAVILYGVGRIRSLWSILKTERLDPGQKEIRKPDSRRSGVCFMWA